MMTSSQEMVAYDQSTFPDLLNQDPEEVRKRFAARFMAAESIDDLFNVLEGNLSKSLAGKTVEIRGVAWAPYESDRGIVPLAVCEAMLTDTGELTEFATTSEALCLFIRRAELIKAIPFTARIAEKRTRSGNTALNFERA